MGNLDLDTTPDMIPDYIKENNIPLCVLSCGIVHSSRVDKPICLSAHVVIDASDKDKVFLTSNWSCGVTVRLRHVQTNRGMHQRDEYEFSDKS